MLKMQCSTNSAAQAGAGGFLFEVFPGTKELDFEDVPQKIQFSHSHTIPMDQLVDLFTLVINLKNTDLHIPIIPMSWSGNIQVSISHNKTSKKM